VSADARRRKAFASDEEIQMHKVIHAALLAFGALSLQEAAAQQANQADQDMKVTGMVTEADQQTREITIEDQTYVMSKEGGGEALFPQVGAEITLFYREEGGQKVITRIGQKQE
jgi:lipopolysaccharide export system protein LptA